MQIHLKLPLPLKRPRRHFKTIFKTPNITIAHWELPTTRLRGICLLQCSDSAVQHFTCPQQVSIGRKLIIATLVSKKLSKLKLWTKSAENQATVEIGPTLRDEQSTVVGREPGRLEQQDHEPSTLTSPWRIMRNHSNQFSSNSKLLLNSIQFSSKFNVQIQHSAYLQNC